MKLMVIRETCLLMKKCNWQIHELICGNVQILILKVNLLRKQSYDGSDIFSGLLYKEILYSNPEHLLVTQSININSFSPTKFFLVLFCNKRICDRGKLTSTKLNIEETGPN